MNNAYIGILVAVLIVLLIVGFGAYNLSKVKIKKSNNQLKKEKKNKSNKRKNNK